MHATCGVSTEANTKFCAEYKNNMKELALGYTQWTTESEVRISK